jgi:hypothetical protein
MQSVASVAGAIASNEGILFCYILIKLMSGDNLQIIQLLPHSCNKAALFLKYICESQPKILFLFTAVCCCQKQRVIFQS